LKYCISRDGRIPVSSALSNVIKAHEQEVMHAQLYGRNLGTIAGLHTFRNCIVIYFFIRLIRDLQDISFERITASDHFNEFTTTAAIVPVMHSCNITGIKSMNKQYFFILVFGFEPAVPYTANVVMNITKHGTGFKV
jgi:hypothetical protein